MRLPILSDNAPNNGTAQHGYTALTVANAAGDIWHTYLLYLPEIFLHIGGESIKHSEHTPGETKHHQRLCDYATNLSTNRLLLTRESHASRFHQLATAYNATTAASTAPSAKGTAIRARSSASSRTCCRNAKPAMPVVVPISVTYTETGEKSRPTFKRNFTHICNVARWLYSSTKEP